MKKVYLNKVKQNGKEFYVLIEDPRIIVKLIPNTDPGDVQEAQRPWNESRVKEIAKYVAGKFKDDENRKSIGLIPNAPILNIKKNLEISTDENGYYIILPESNEEFDMSSDSIEVIDGQHRIRAFMEDYLDTDFSDNPYEMIFSVFYKLSEREKKELFMITNEKQVKVPANLLRLYKRDLDLLKGDEKTFDLVLDLNKEDFSPLKDRIIIGAKKIPKGYQESQLSKIINKTETYKTLEAYGFDRTTMAKIISNYLNAWENVYAVSYQEPGKDTLTKISGLRYIFYLFPTILEILTNRQKYANCEEFRKIIKLLPEAIEVEDVFNSPLTSLNFRSEGATIQMAKDHIRVIKVYEQQHQNNFNIAEGL